MELLDTIKHNRLRCKSPQLMPPTFSGKSQVLKTCQLDEKSKQTIRKLKMSQL